MTCFNAQSAERTLAVRLGIPIFANDPALEHLGSKSGSRHVFRAADVPMPDGCEDLRDPKDGTKEAGAPLAEGGIGLQSEGQEIFYRNFVIRELKP